VAKEALAALVDGAAKDVALNTRDAQDARDVRDNGQDARDIQDAREKNVAQSEDASNINYFSAFIQHALLQ